MNTIAINKKSTSLRLTEGLYNHIQKLAKKENRSVNNYIETILFDAVGYHEPNETTKVAMKEIEENRASLKRFDNVEDMFKELDDE